MRFAIRPFDHAHADLMPEEDDPPPPALRLLPADLDSHAEDVFLGEFRTFLRTTLHLTRSERAVADELARAALDQVNDPEGDFAAMPVTAWLVAAMPARAREGVSHDVFGWLALAFVTFLRASRRIESLGARRLRRSIAGLDDLPCAHAA